MSPTLILIATFAGAAVCVVGIANLAFDLVLRDRARLQERLREAFRDETRDRAEQSPLFKDLQQLAAGNPLSLDSWGRKLQTWIDQSGVSWTVTQALLVSLSAALAAYALLVVATGNLLVPAGLAPVTAAAPWIYLFAQRLNRRRKLCSQLPDAFDVMSRSLRAGQTVQAAFQVVANDFPAPVKDEFAYCYEQQHLGVSQEAALRDLARRTGIMELQIFVVAMIVNGRSGGNLAELLSKLANLIRQRIKLYSRLRALTGEGRMQAIVLTTLPAVLLASLFVLNREYVQVLLDRPAWLWGCLASQAIGAVWIARIMQIDE